MNPMKTLRRAAAFFAAVLLAGCAGLPGAQIRQVDSRPLEMVVQPGAGPVVVFENGLGGHMAWWGKVLPALPAGTAYFAYNRPGLGKSAPADTPRDGEHIVQELRRTLLLQGMPPPYVLVGHSLGGLYMQLFARKYRQEVAALVLVDSTHPRQLEGAGAIESQSLLVRGMAKALITGTAKNELDGLTQTGQQVLSLPTVTDMPVYVLSAAEPMKETSDLAKFSNAMRQDLAHMYPNAKQVWVESGHAIPLEKPEAVVNAVRAAMAEARTRL
ncbi:MAG: alpha/beta hydrolase [Hydrogenophaga sp.]|nr:alpha/beta hydrolase [Hydrogenophaga sp.]